MYRYFVKRVLDVVISLNLVILLFPLMVLLCVFIIIDLHEWPIYGEMRPGRNEKLFYILKLKSMTTITGISDRERITRLGASLRKYSLDELPQLWNVLTGSMSLIGPRPLKKEYLPYYKPSERIRHSIRPGITGLAQVSGRNRLSWDERLRLDSEYVLKYSFYFDLHILLKTVIAVLKAENVAVIPDDLETDLNTERR